MRVPVPGEGLKLFGKFRPHRFCCAVCFAEHDGAIEAAEHIRSHRNLDLVTRLRAKGTFERQLTSPPKIRCAVSVGHDLNKDAVPCREPATRVAKLFKDSSEVIDQTDFLYQGE